MALLLLIVGIFLIVALLTAGVRRIALSVQLLDLPVARSAHNRPTPVGGGLGIAAVFLLAVIYFYSDGTLPFPEFMALLGSAVVAATGLVDDYRHLDIRWRMPWQVLAAVWSVSWLGSVPAIDFGLWILPASVLLDVLAVLALLWLLNLYNFMDGIDGIAGSELVYVAMMALVLGATAADQSLSSLSAILVGAGAGFLLWNWPPARIFLGDVGSGFIGFNLGILALLSMHHGSLSVWTWVLLLGVFIADATVTLARRFLAGEKWYEGHASHAYQNLARKYKSHAKVTIIILVINCFWLAPLAWFSVRRPEFGFLLAIIGLAPLVLLAIRANAGGTTSLAAAAQP